MHQNHCNRKEVLKETYRGGVIKGILFHVRLLAKCRFYGYFSMKERTKQGILASLSTFFSSIFDYTQSMHKQTIIDFKELGLRQLFTKPLKELKTRDLDQVETLLREVEAYQEAGFYAVGYVSYEAAPAF